MNKVKLVKVCLDNSYKWPMMEEVLRSFTMNILSEIPSFKTKQKIKLHLEEVSSKVYQKESYSLEGRMIPDNVLQNIIGLLLNTLSIFMF